MSREAHSHAEARSRYGHSLHAVHVLEQRLEEMERDIVELIRQRDEAVEQRDRARDIACQYEALLARNGNPDVYTAWTK